MKFAPSVVWISLICIFSTLLPTATGADPTMDEEIQNNLRKRLLYNADCIQKLSTVTVVDGISEAEVGIIAKNLEARYISCGGVDSITDEGDRWIIHFGIGYVGSRKVDAIVQKSDGAITSQLIQNKAKSPYYLWD